MSSDILKTKYLLLQNSQLINQVKEYKKLTESQQQYITQLRIQIDHLNKKIEQLKTQHQNLKNNSYISLQVSSNNSDTVSNKSVLKKAIDSKENIKKSNILSERNTQNISNNYKNPFDVPSVDSIKHAHIESHNNLDTSLEYLETSDWENILRNELKTNTVDSLNSHNNDHFIPDLIKLLHPLLEPPLKFELPIIEMLQDSYNLEYLLMLFFYFEYSNMDCDFLSQNFYICLDDLKNQPLEIIKARIETFVFNIILNKSEIIPFKMNEIPERLEILQCNSERCSICLKCVVKQFQESLILKPSNGVLELCQYVQKYELMVVNLFIYLDNYFNFRGIFLNNIFQYVETLQNLKLDQLCSVLRILTMCAYSQTSYDVYFRAILCLIYRYQPTVNINIKICFELLIVFFPQIFTPINVRLQDFQLSQFGLCLYMISPSSLKDFMISHQLFKNLPIEIFENRRNDFIISLDELEHSCKIMQLEYFGGYSELDILEELNLESKCKILFYLKGNEWVFDNLINNCVLPFMIENVEYKHPNVANFTHLTEYLKFIDNFLKFNLHNFSTSIRHLFFNRLSKLKKSISEKFVSFPNPQLEAIESTISVILKQSSNMIIDLLPN